MYPIGQTLELTINMREVAVIINGTGKLKGKKNFRD